MVGTPNHSYNRPDKGAQDWNQPLNANFADLDTDIEVRDVAANRSNYDPQQGAKFLATDTGVIYEGDGSSWTAAFVVPGYDASTDEAQLDQLNVATLTGTVTGGTAVSNLAGTGLSIDSGSLGLSSDTVTVAGNAVSLGESTAINHADLSTVSADQHHAKDHDHTESDVSTVPNAGLTNSSLSVAGNAVSLGGSTGITHGNLSNIGSDDHHTRPSAGTGLTETSNAFDVVPSAFAGTYLSDDGAGNLTIDVGNGLENDGSDNLQAALGNALGFDGSNQIAVTTDSVTVAGNSVSLGGSTGISHADLGGVSADQHHAKDHDHTESDIAAVPNSGLVNSSVTVSAGNGLKNGGSVALGSATTLDVEPSDFAAEGLADDGSDSLAVAPGGITASKIATGAVTTTELSDGTIHTNDLGQNGATDGHVLRWNGSDWETGFPGTTSDTAFELLVSGDSVFRLEPTTFGQNVIAGDPGNAVVDGARDATIGGGGAPNTNTVSDNYGTVAGGSGNTAGDEDGDSSSSRYATVGGGSDNTASGQESTVAGGTSNTASGQNATISGGQGNTASSTNATVGGGINNEASEFYATVSGGNSNVAKNQLATVAGGDSNTASGLRSTIAGGIDNTASGSRATVGGGRNNLVEGDYATIGGGGPSDTSSPGQTRNVAFDNYGTIGGGGGNQVGVNDSDPTTAKYTTVAGGKDNTASSQWASVGGGQENTASGPRAQVGGGYNNTATDNNATVAGGRDNTAGGSSATIAGGNNNTASAREATVLGGRDNTASANYATVLGGFGNTADGDYSLAFGQEADTNGNAGAIVFADSSSTAIQAQNKNEMRVQMPIYAKAFNTTSARAAKTDVEPVDPESVLEGVESLGVSRWQFTDTDDGTHIGPMAEEFQAVFDVGDSDEHISTVDADGVAFAAIQGLAAKLDDAREELDERDEQLDSQADRIEELEAENETLRERLAAVEKHLAAVEDQPTSADD